MFRFTSLIPGILTAVIVTTTTSLYLTSRQKVEELTQKADSLETELEQKDAELANLQKLLALNKEIKRKEATLSTRDNSLAHMAPDVGHGQNPEGPAVPEKVATPPTNQITDKRIESKVRAISKFVPVSESQAERLRQKFREELAGGTGESLEEIVGTEAAEFYREQRKSAFERVLHESIEKEILFISRKLALDNAQEDALRKTYFDIEAEIQRLREDRKNSGSKNSTIERLVLEEKERSRMITERSRDFLTPPQFEALLEYQSGNQDMQLWHE